MTKVYFRDLSTALKFFVFFGWVVIIAFIISFLLGIFGYYS